MCRRAALTFIIFSIILVASLLVRLCAVFFTVEATLSGKPVERKSVNAFGCSIKRW
jgi:hypothetical protein